MKNWIHWNRQMWVFCLPLFLAACECDCKWFESPAGQTFVAVFTGCTPVSPPSSRLTGGLIEENLGQADRSYSLVVRGPGGRTLFSDQGVAFDFGRGLRLRLGLDGSEATRIEAEDPLVTKVNYFMGKNPSRWVRNARTWGRVRYRSIYPGIDMVFYGISPQSGALEQDFVLSKGADPSRIRMRFDGADGVKVAHDGSLEVRAGKREIHFHAPVVYQKVDGGRRLVRSAYKTHPDGHVGFELGSYRTDIPLVIDPVISFSSYAGTAGNDLPGRVVLDALGNMYLSGATNDPAFPVSSGAYTLDTPGSVDEGDTSATITKLDPTGSKALYITHFGGSLITYATGMTLDGSGNILIVGHTDAPDFPTTPGAVQSTPKSSTASAAFVTKLDAAGDKLLYSTYLGGSGSEIAMAVVTDSKGNAYVAGSTSSPDFPVTAGAFMFNFRPVSNGLGSHGFVSKLSPDGTQLIYSTFFGGSGTELIGSLALDAQNNVYLTGSTTSSDLPVTKGALSTTYGGGSTDGLVNFGDAFVAKINPSGSALVYCTYLGGKLDDVGTAIAVDTVGNALRYWFDTFDRFSDNGGRPANEVRRRRRRRSEFSDR
jgi:hypothetical protein